MNLRAAARFLPAWKNVLLAVLASVLLILAFPPFELWFTAWFALVPLLWAIEREGSVRRSFILGWLFGNIFFFGTCWWLTFAPITYAGFPAPLAYLLLFCVTSVAGVFPALFAALTAFLLRQFGSKAFLAVPFVWVFTEFIRYWLIGNNWNAIGYSQAFVSFFKLPAAYGGVLLVSFNVLTPTAAICFLSIVRRSRERVGKHWIALALLLFVFPVANRLFTVGVLQDIDLRLDASPRTGVARLIALQPNVPMSGLNLSRWQDLRRRHVSLAQAGIGHSDNRPYLEGAPTIVVFPESPMNFMYEDDPETKEFINGFAAKNNVSVLFNSAEPDPSNGKFFNSAVLVGPQGKEVAQYDKIFLLPFGEAVPFPLEGLLPGFVGNFSYGSEYDLLPLGEAKAGVMICFESHFGQLSREYVRDGADAILEMTNDGYLGPTPVLRQHLANAVFRAVETNRPVLRVTNIGITAYVNERGEALDAAASYVEDIRVWSVPKSNGSQTFYVKYGDWFAWLCLLVTVGLLSFGIFRRKLPLPSGNGSG